MKPVWLIAWNDVTLFLRDKTGYMVMFVLMNLLLFGGISISEERAGGVILRLASYPVTRAEVIFGKLTGRFLLGVVQILFFLLAGRLVFNVDYGEHLGLILLLMAVYGWSCAALGVWIGAVFTSADKVKRNLYSDRPRGRCPGRVLVADRTRSGHRPRNRTHLSHRLGDGRFASAHQFRRRLDRGSRRARRACRIRRRVHRRGRENVAVVISEAGRPSRSDVSEINPPPASPTISRVSFAFSIRPLPQGLFGACRM